MTLETGLNQALLELETLNKASGSAKWACYSRFLIAKCSDLALISVT
jgi:hypothetical protein